MSLIRFSLPATKVAGTTVELAVDADVAIALASPFGDPDATPIGLLAHSPELLIWLLAAGDSGLPAWMMVRACQPKGY